MDTPVATKPVKINRWLPYWAVFQADVRQTMQSWVYRTWVLLSTLAALGYLLFRVGPYREAGIRQLASTFVSDLLRWTVLGSMTLIIVLTVGSIASERGTLADSVLSRGISRYQYFMGKLHARLVTILATFFVMSALALTGSFFLLYEDLSLIGSGVALAAVAGLLAAVITCGVSVSALVNSSVMGIAILWIALYGTGFALWFAPSHFPSPYKVLSSLPYMLQGDYDLHSLGQIIGWAALVSGVVALFSIVFFSRRDV